MSVPPLSQIPIIHHGALNERSDHTVAEQVVEQIEGEVRLDSYVKAQCSAPQVIQRITELENGLWRVCQELIKFDPNNPAIDEVKLLLKNILEVDESAHRFHSALGDKT